MSLKDKRVGYFFDEELSESSPILKAVLCIGSRDCSRLACVTSVTR